MRLNLQAQPIPELARRHHKPEAYPMAKILIRRAEMAQKSTQSNRYGIDNLTYNIIAVLHEKAQGMEAFEQYLQDAQGDNEVRQCFEELQRQDRENIQKLQNLLRNRLGGQNQGQRAA
jgi:hypothetical protein